MRWSRKVEQARVGVVGVLDQQAPPAATPPAARRTAATRRTAPPAPARCRCRPGKRHAEQPTQPRTHIGSLVRIGDEPLQPGGQLGRGRCRRGLPLRCPAAGGRSRPAPRTPRPPRRTGTGPGATRRLGARPSTYFSNSQPSRDLPTPAGPGDQHQPRHLALGGGVKQLLDRAQLRVPADQRRLQAVDPLDTTHPGQHPGRPPQPLRLGLALQPVRSGLGKPDRAARQPLRRGVHQHRPWLRRRLHPRRGVHRVTGDHPLADRPQRDRHLAGHHPGPGRQIGHADVGAQLGPPR